MTLTDSELGAATRIVLRLDWKPATESGARILGQAIIDRRPTWTGDLVTEPDSQRLWMVKEIDIPEHYLDEDTAEEWTTWVIGEVESVLNLDPPPALRDRFT